MRIVVPIKQVPETSNVKMDPETGTMVRSGVESIVNPLDLYAIEAALRLRDEVGSGQITTLSMGPPSASRALREAVAMGCDDGVLLSDRQFAGADTWATSYTLSRAIGELGDVDLIICGERATDGDTGQVGPGIASFLDLPLATYVSHIALHDGGLRLKRLVEGGTEVLWTPLPVVLTVVKEIAYPRLPTLRGKLRAKAMEIPVWGPEDVDLDPTKIGLKGSPTRVVKIDRPKVARQGEMLHVKSAEDAERAASHVVAFLRERRLI